MSIFKELTSIEALFWVQTAFVTASVIIILRCIASSIETANDDLHKLK